MQLIDKSLEKYGREPQCDSDEFLFGSEFTSYLKNQVETDTSLAQVLSMSQRFHPYNNSRQLTIGRTKQQFFSRGPCQEMGVSAGQLSHPNSLSIKRSFILQEQGIQSTQLSPIKEVLERLPQPRESLMCLKMDISLIATHAHISVGGRLALFSHNWHCLTQDPWVLTVVQGYQLPLSQWPRRNIMESKLHLDQVQGKALQAEITGLIAKGAVVPACKSQVHILSPLCSAKKWRGLAPNNRPQEVKSIHQATSLQNGGFIHATNSGTKGFLHG